MEAQSQTVVVSHPHGSRKSIDTHCSSTIALNFSTDLDNIFNLGTVGELAMNVEQKYGESQMSRVSRLTSV